MQLANNKSMERHNASEIENLQEKLKQETGRLKERLELEHSREVQKVKTTCEGVRSDLELARIQNEQLKEQVTLKCTNYQQNILICIEASISTSVKRYCKFKSLFFLKK